MTRPDGVSVDAETVFRGTDVPGIYRIGSDRFAVNVPPAAGRTAPVDRDALEAAGVSLGADAPAADPAAAERRRDTELENEQKLWRWIAVTVMGILLLETWLAGRLSRPATLELGRNRYSILHAHSANVGLP